MIWLFSFSINETNFWRNYFYRVSLICQANELSFMSREGDSQATETTSDQPIGEQRFECMLVAPIFFE